MQADDSMIIFNGYPIRFGDRPWSTLTCNGPSWGALYPVDDPRSDSIGYATERQFFTWLRARKTMTFPEIIVNGRACVVA